MDIKELKKRYENAKPIENINEINIIAMNEEDKNWLIQVVEEQQKEINWLYGKLNTIWDVIEQARIEKN